MKHQGITQSIKKRLPWLCLLFFLGMLVSSVVGIFESLVSELALVVCFQSLVLGMAGNVGTQSLALTIRMITKDSDGRNTKRKYRAAILRELVTGLAAGIFLAALSFVSVGAYICLLRGESISYASRSRDALRQLSRFLCRFQALSVPQLPFFCKSSV